MRPSMISFEKEPTMKLFGERSGGKRHAAMGVLVAAAVIVCYANSINGSFHYDDISSIVNNPSIKSLNPVRVWKGNSRFRFVGFYSFALNYHFNGFTDLRGWHYVNIALHALCAVLVYAMLLGIAGAARTPGSAVPFMGALLFAVHPLCSEPVNYIQARHVLFYTLFTLTGLLSAVVFFYARTRMVKCASFTCAVISMVLGMLSKEVGALYVPSAIAVYFLTFGMTTERISRARAAMIGAAIVLVVMATGGGSYLLTLFGRSYHNKLGEMTLLARSLTGAEVFWRYVSLIVPLSSRLNVDHYVELVNVRMASQLIPALFAVLGMGAMVVGAFVVRVKESMVCFLLLWVIMGMLPYIPAPGTVEFMVEYKAYLPAIGLMGLMAWCFEWISNALARRRSARRARVVMGAVFALLIVWCVRETRFRNRVWTTEVALWSDAAEKSPGKARPYANRGVAYLRAGDYERAFADFNRSLSLEPDNLEALGNRGIAYDRRGDRDRAIADFDRALRIDPDRAEIYNNRGIAFKNKGEYDRAISDFSAMVRINPLHAEAYNNRGVVYLWKGALDESIHDFNESIRIDPRCAEAYTNRGAAYGRKGDYERAIADFTRALSIDSEKCDAYKNRGITYLQKNDCAKARDDLAKAREKGCRVEREIIESAERMCAGQAPR